MFRKNRWNLLPARILAAIAALSLCLSARAAQSVTVGWDVSSIPGVSGYYLYYGTQSENYTTRVDAGTNTQLTVGGLTEGSTCYFALTSYNTSGIESAPSGEISYLVPGILQIHAVAPFDPVYYVQFPVVPGNWYEVQASTNLCRWTAILQTAAVITNSWMYFVDLDSTTYSMRFYRLVSHPSSTLAPPLRQVTNQNSDTVVLSWNSGAGQIYQVQYSASGSPTDWENLGGIVVATGPVETLPFTIDPNFRGSYRVISEGPVSPPFIQSVWQDLATVNFAWNTIPGVSYQVQYTTNILTPAWQNLGSPINADDYVATAFDSIGPDPQRFYRVLLLGTLPPISIQSMVQYDGKIAFSWNSEPGQVYQVQFTTSLTQPNWQNLGLPIVAEDSLTTASDGTGLDPQRFYRVVAQFY